MRLPEADLVVHQSHSHNYHHHNHYYLNWPYLLVSCSLANWLGEYPGKSFAGRHKRQQTEIKRRHLPVERRGKTATSLSSSVTVMTVSTTVHNYAEGKSNATAAATGYTYENTHFPTSTCVKYTDQRTQTHKWKRSQLYTLLCVKKPIMWHRKEWKEYCSYVALICVGSIGI